MIASHVDVASNDDGQRIGELARACGFGVDLDWSEVYPYWLVARNESGIVGCICVSLGKPIGRLEMLCVDPGLDHRERAMVVKRLVLSGTLTLKQAGSQVIMGAVPFELKSYKKLLKKRGAVVAFSGNMMLRVL